MSRPDKKKLNVGRAVANAGLRRPDGQRVTVHFEDGFRLHMIVYRGSDVEMEPTVATCVKRHGKVIEVIRLAGEGRS